MWAHQQLCRQLLGCTLSSAQQQEHHQPVLATPQSTPQCLSTSLDYTAVWQMCRGTQATTVMHCCTLGCKAPGSLQQVKQQQHADWQQQPPPTRCTQLQPPANARLIRRLPWCLCETPASACTQPPDELPVWFACSDLPGVSVCVLVCVCACGMHVVACRGSPRAPHGLIFDGRFRRCPVGRWFFSALLPSCMQLCGGVQK